MMNWTWTWSIIMLIALIIEIITSGTLVSIWFTIGGFFALILSLFNVHSLIQCITFTVVSGVCILLFRPLSMKVLRGNITPTNADRLIGTHARLTKAILEDHWGQIEMNGTAWSCASYNNQPIENETLVTILAIEGAKLIVKSID